MKSCAISFVAAIAVLAALAGSVAAVEVWDTTTDFSDQGNPTWPWSYGWEPNVGGPFQLYTYRFFAPDTGVFVWARNITVPGGPAPSAWKNKTSTEWYCVKPGEVSLHPGYYGEASLARWTSPVTGQVTVEGWFGAGDRGLMSGYIQHNGVTIWYSPSFPIDQPFSISLAVNHFDNVDFLVADGYGYGNTPIHATITYSGGDLLKISGKVTDGNSRKGLAGVALAVTSGNRTFNGTTNADGRYVLDGLWAGTYKIVFSKDGYRPASVKNIVLPPNRTVSVKLTKKRGSL